MYTIITLIAAIVLLVLTGFSTNLLHKVMHVKESRYLSFVCSLTTFITIVGAWIFSVMLLIEIIGANKSEEEKEVPVNQTISAQGSILTSWIK